MSSRPYSHPDDLPRIIDFLRAARLPERVADFPGPTDLEEMLAEPEKQQSTRLWLDAQGGLVAYAILSDYENLNFDILPARFDAVGAEIVSWAVERVQGKKGECIYASCLDDNSTRQAFLQLHGFELQPDTTLHYARPIDLPIPEPLLPPGFVIRAVKGEAEAEAAADLHRAAFGTDYMTTANRLNMMRTSEYDPQMDLVAVAPDGRLAAYTMGSISVEENARTGRKVGYTDPVATHPDFQRLGLARALLLTAMKMLQQRGMATARLGTSSENLAMQKTAESVGFVLENRALWFKKPVE